MAVKYNLDKSSHLLNYRSKSRKLVWMDPELFNLLAIPMATRSRMIEQGIPPSKYEKEYEIDSRTGRGYYKSKLKPLEKRLKKGGKLDPLYLDVDIKDCRVTSHEGRHRAFASQKLGIKKVPVLVYFRKDKYFIEEHDINPKDVKCCVNSHCNLKKETKYR